MAGSKTLNKSKVNALKIYSGNKSYIKGKLFEKALQKLLLKAGFSTDISGQQVTKNQKRLHGRGATYDPDFFKQFSLGIPFINPLMLVLEAKNYNQRIGLNIVREFLGAFIDISQFARIDTRKGGHNRYDILYDTRYNYCPVLFSLKGFQRKSEGFMFAHGINFISYENSEIMTKIFILLEDVVNKLDFSKFEKDDFKLFDELEMIINVNVYVKREGFDGAYRRFMEYLNKVNSLIGVLDFKYPVHILYDHAISASYTRPVRLVQKKDNLFILENIVKRKFGEFSFSRSFLKDYLLYAKKRDLLDNVLRQIDVVQVTNDTITLRKLNIDATSRRELIDRLINTTSSSEESADVSSSNTEL